jgi:hypothetical protein
MSGFLGAAMPTPRIMAKDMMLAPTYRARNVRPRKTERNCALHVPCGYQTDFWPGRRGFIGDQGADVGLKDNTWARRMERLAHGIASRVGFPGVTRDQYGTPLAACTVILHKTSTRELVYDGVSDANGNFLAQSVYAGEGHYLVFHKAGAVNVFGATDNNLIGA